MAIVSDLWARVAVGERDLVLQFMTEPPVKVGELATRLGLRVLRSPLEPNISGLIQPSDQAASGFEIRVNKFESPERQRFTVAHEIAHYLLHRLDIGKGVVDSIMYRSALTSRKEVEANRLAAEIVMPYPLIRDRLERIGHRPTEDTASSLARDFGVSAPAMRIRLGLS